MSSDHRVVIRYTLFQIPDLILMGLALVVAVRWWELPILVAYTIFGLWVLKDIVMFPMMRVAYGEGELKNDRLTGATGIARDALDPTGYVVVGSESWMAEVVPGAAPISAGAEIRVIQLEGLTLRVEQAETDH